MDVFLSYASEERALAERVCRVLETEGHDVFFDRDDLGGGDAFGERIRTAIAGADVLVYLISRFSVASRSYALTELAIASTLSRRRRPAILPVRTDDTPIDAVPATLRAYTILEPQGDGPAEIAHAIARLQTQKRQRQLMLGAAGVLVAAVVLAIYMASRPSLAVPPTGASTAPAGSSGTHPAGAVAETVAVAAAPDPVDALNAAILRRTAPERRVMVTGMPGNDGWTAVLILADRTASKVFYRLEGESAFADTGSTAIPNPMTGEPMPNTTIRLPGEFWHRRKIAVKYRDAKGVEHGEYQVDFDPRTEFLKFTRQALGSVGWVTFQNQSPGRTLAYFTTLLSFKAAFTQIRYSLDSAALDLSYPFKTDPSQGWPARMDDDQLFITIPPPTKFVTVGLVYVDGTMDTRRIDVTR